jgi:hypothetical protein
MTDIAYSLSSKAITDEHTIHYDILELVFKTTLHTWTISIQGHILYYINTSILSFKDILYFNNCLHVHMYYVNTLVLSLTDACKHTTNILILQLVFKDTHYTTSIRLTGHIFTTSFDSSHSPRKNSRKSIPSLT